MPQRNICRNTIETIPYPTLSERAFKASCFGAVIKGHTELFSQFLYFEVPEQQERCTRNKPRTILTYRLEANLLISADHSERLQDEWIRFQSRGANCSELILEPCTEPVPRLTHVEQFSRAPRKVYPEICTQKAAGAVGNRAEVHSKTMHGYQPQN